MQKLRLMQGSYLPLAQIEQWISDRALNAEEATARSTQHLALTQVMMMHSITSLRVIAHLDWRSFVEGQSAMEAVLRSDPAGYYGRMTFGTRDRYRHVVERIARRTGQTEDAVVHRAIDLARQGDDIGDTQSCRSHVGYYLIDDGLPILEAQSGYRPKPGEAVHRWVLRHPNIVFVGGVLAGTIAALGAVLWLGGPPARAVWLAVLMLGIIPASDIAISVVNQLVTAFLPPRVLPKLDLHRSGIPAEYRTVVVIPTLFGGVAAVHEAVRVNDCETPGFRV